MPHDRRSTSDTSRRRFLQGTGASAVAVSMGGCIGDEEETDEETTSTPTEEPDEEEESTPEEVDDEEDVPEGGDFRYGLSQPPADMNPLTVSSAYDWAILGLVYESGTITDPVDFEVKPWAFTDWTVENVDSGEPDVYIDVRDGLTWNDGEPFTVDDVVFTYNYIMETGAPWYAGAVEPIDYVEPADGEWDVHMKLTEPVGVYDSDQLQVALLPEHVWSEVDEPLEYQPPEAGEGRPVGLGPGIVTRYEPDTSVELTFRDDYELTGVDWLEDHPNLRAGGPFLDSLRVMVYGSTSALQEAFVSEDAIDAVYGSIEPARVEEVEEKESARIIVGSDVNYGHYSFNMRNPPLDCTSFRQSLGFAFDHVYWIDQLNRGYEQRGNFVMPPGYEAVRPETEQGAEINEHEATKAFDFLEGQPGVMDVEAVKAYLREGEVITGEEGSYAGGEREYPGSLTGARTDHEEALYDYTWDEVESDVLADEPGVEEEIRVDGETIPELLGRPLRMLMYPPQDSPLSTQMVENFVGQLRSLGIPVEREVMTFNTMLDVVYVDLDFDIYPMGWTSLSPFAVSSLEGLFHSDEAHGPDSDQEVFLSNSMGYGLEGLPGADDLIDEAARTMDEEERNRLARRAVEKVYLDYPTQVNSYSIPQWPVNDEEWDGFVDGIPSPGGYPHVIWQFRNVYRRE